MTYMDRYTEAERPTAEKVLLDLAIFHIGIVRDRLNSLITSYPNEGIDDKEAADIANDLTVAERVLGMTASLVGPRDWPWDSEDFHDFWSLGGDAREVRSMVTYLGQMPDHFRVFMQAQSMPSEYGQALLDGIPRWHN